MKEFFTISGKLTRGQYAIALFLKLILPLTILFIVGSIATSIHFGPELIAGDKVNQEVAERVWSYIFIAILLYVLIIEIFWIILANKRLRDLDKNVAFSVFTLFPIINIFFLGYLLFAPTKILTEEEMNRERIPTGMMLYLILLGFGFFGYIISIFTGKISMIQFWPAVITGVWAIVFQCVFLLLMIAWFIGIIKRYTWAYYVVFFHISLGLLLLIANTIWYIVNPDLIDIILNLNSRNSMYNLEQMRWIMKYSLWFSFTLSFIYNSIFLRYIIKRENYFSR